MKIIQPLKDLFTYPTCLILSQWPIFLNIVFETTIGDQLKDDFNSLVVRTDVKCVVLDDVWMAELFENGDLAL